MLIIVEFLHLFGSNPLIFPSLKEIFNNFFNLIAEVDTFKAIGLSLLRTIFALLFSFIFASILGILAGYNKNIANILKPLIATLKCIPVPCFVFILFIYFPFNKLISITTIVFMVIFPIMYEASKTGIENIDKSIVNSLKIEGQYKFNSIFKVSIPLALPYLFLSFLTSFGLAIKVEITAETLMNSNSLEGLGRILYSAYSNNEFSKIYALVLIILIIFIILDTIIFILKRTFLKKY